MAAAAASSSLSLTKFLPFLSPSTTTNTNYKSQLQFPFSLSSLPPSISLKTPKNPRNGGGLVITSMGTYNVQVVVDDNESEDRLLNRFRREVFRAGVIQESKRRRFFENSQEKRKRKSREAAKRNRRRRPQARAPIPKPDDKESTKKETYDFENDNWELPEGDLPY